MTMKRYFCGCDSLYQYFVELASDREDEESRDFLRLFGIITD